MSLNTNYFCRMKFSYTCILVLMLLSNRIMAQSPKGTLRGNVTTLDGQPAAFINVVVKGGKVGVTTDGDGNFTLRNLPEGEQTLLVSAVGFEPIEQTVTVSSNPEATVSVSLKSTAKQLGEVVVTGQKRRTATATKLDVPLLDIPVSVQIVGQDLIQQQQIINMADVVKNVSGVTLTGSYSGGYQFFNSRGFDMNNWTNFRRNGTLLWNMGNHFADFYENIEFLKGPAAILYGDVAPGGIINFVTKKPLNYNYRRIDLKVGQYGLVRPSVDISGPLNASRTLKYRLNATYERSNSFRDVVNNKTLMLAPVITWDISPRLSWTVEANYKKDNRVGDPGLVSPDRTFQGLSRLPINTFLGEKSATYNYLNTSLFSTVNYQLSRSWSVRNLLSYTLTERTPLNIYPQNDADSLGNITRQQYYFKQRFNTYTASLDLVGSVTTGPLTHNVLVGADYVEDTNLGLGFLSVEIPGTFNMFRPNYGEQVLEPFKEEADNYRSFYTRWGFYAQDQIGLFNDRLQVLLGLRYNQYTNGNRYDNASDVPEGYKPVEVNPLIPRVGLVYKPRTWMSVYGSYSQSYEVNGFDYIDPNLMLQNTKGDQIEVGVKSNLLRERLGVTVALFRINKDNVYTYADSDQLPTGFPIINWSEDERYYTYYAPRYQSQGIEVDVNGRITDNLKVNANASFIRAEVVDDPAFPKGNWLPNQPRQSYSVWASYRVPRLLPGLELGYGIFHKGQFYGALDNTVASLTRPYSTMDASIAYAWKGFRTQLNVTNLTNQTSYLRQFGGCWEPQWPRRAILGVSYKF